MDSTEKINQVDSSGISIGMPVYNTERFIRKRLDSILTQSFENFELIISDNGSTDSTPSICEEFSKKDNRIRYFRQEKNMGMIWNFNFVLSMAKFDYFCWAAADDYWQNDFLKKNFEVLRAKENVVCCVAKFDEFAEINESKSMKEPVTFKIMRKLRTKFLRADMHTLSGSYEKKVREYLKYSMCEVFYGLHRTRILQKNFVNIDFNGLDWATDLNLLRIGDIYVIDEVLWRKYEKGASSSGIINLSAQVINTDKIGIVFPYYHLTNWFIKNHGWKMFLKNLDYFVWLNCSGGVSLLLDFIRIILKI